MLTSSHPIIKAIIHGRTDDFVRLLPTIVYEKWMLFIYTVFFNFRSGYDILIEKYPDEYLMETERNITFAIYGNNMHVISSYSKEFRKMRRSDLCYLYLLSLHVKRDEIALFIKRYINGQSPTLTSEFRIRTMYGAIRPFMASKRIIDSIRDNWSMEHPRFNNHIQWLPREHIDDLIDTLIDPILSKI